MSIKKVFEPISLEWREVPLEIDRRICKVQWVFDSVDLETGSAWESALPLELEVVIEESKKAGKEI
jgi:hypothetical protein